MSNLVPLIGIEYDGLYNKNTNTTVDTSEDRSVGLGSKEGDGGAQTSSQWRQGVTSAN